MYYYRSMRLLSNLCLVFTALASGSAVAAERTEGGSAELILFGANWCAPCRAELADLQALAQAVWPQPLVVAWIDGTPALGKAGAPSNVRVLDRRAAQALFGTFGTINAGVPLAIMRDRQGRICAVFKERVHVAALAAARQNCGI